jgi:L-2-hydroxyglutarate oxidase LhgO
MGLSVLINAGWYKFIVATNEDEAKKVADLAIQSQRNGVENVQLIDGSHVRRLEPSLNAMLALDAFSPPAVCLSGYPAGRSRLCVHTGGR